MKRLLIIAMMCASTWVVSAQDYLGFQLGYARPITYLNTADSKKTLTPNAYNGLKVGFVYDATIVKGFGVTMGLNYTFGANSTDWKDIHEGYSTAQERFKTMYHQVELLVDWQYKFEIAKETWLILYTGPTLQYGLQLKDKWYANNGKEISVSHTDNRYSKEDMGERALNQLNVTWGVGAGFQYERYFLRGGYDFGLINPYKAQIFAVSDDYNPYTRGRFDQWQIKIGMYLWQF
jgi:hypothetical protein